MKFILKFHKKQKSELSCDCSSKKSYTVSFSLSSCYNLLAEVIILKKFILLCLIITVLSGCGEKTVSGTSAYKGSSTNSSDKRTDVESITSDKAPAGENNVDNFDSEEIVSDTVKHQKFINPSGKTLRKRVSVPEGYKRIKVKKESFAAFLRNYKLKPDGSPVLLYNGNEKGNQSAHIAVFKLPLENEDLQQCADSIMRIYGEYYYKNKAYNKIKFVLGNGFIADFDKWKRGYAISISGNNISWKASSKNDESYESFKRFMRIVFAYSGTLNMDNSSKKIPLSKAKAGDIFIKGGSPGHVVMIVDVCKNAFGKKAYLLAQGYMPAQEFQLLKNPLREADPWYYEDEITYPLRTPEYSFDEGSLRRYK